MQFLLRPLYSQRLLSALCCLPALTLLYDALNQNLNVADPGRSIVFFLGEWSFWFLLLCLTIRPLSVSLKNPRIFPARRTLGLFCLGYASMHLLAWGTFMLGWQMDQIGLEIMESPFIIVGMAAIVLMIPLGLSSTKRAQIKMGFKRWRYLHMLIYPAAILACLHFAWLSKDWLEPAIYSVILATLFVWRFIIIMKRLEHRRES